MGDRNPPLPLGEGRGEGDSQHKELRTQHHPPSPISYPPTPEYVAIGHVTVDHLAAGIAPGGSATYASVTAARLGLRAGVLTAAGTELDWDAYLPGVEVVRSPSPHSTTFENRYRDGLRTQRLLALADALSPDSLPERWRRAPIVHLAPVAHEVGGTFAGVFPRSLVAITPQGLLRHWDEDGIVGQGSWTGGDSLLESCKVAIFSEEDLAGDGFFLDLCLRKVDIVVLTRGARGATLFREGQEESFPGFPVREVDPTGAGDVFAAAFLIEYNLGRDPRRAAAFACCAASFAVEQPGMAGIPDRTAVEARLATYREIQTGWPG